MAEVYSIYMAAPLLIPALSVPLLGERVDLAPLAAIGVGLRGVLLMIAPRGGQWVSLGALLALVAAVTYALAASPLRRLTRTDRTASMVFWFTALLAWAPGCSSIPGWVPLAASHWPLVARRRRCRARSASTSSPRRSATRLPRWSRRSNTPRCCGASCWTWWSGTFCQAQ